LTSTVPKVISTPDIFIKERSASDDFIICASDGFWDEVTEVDMISEVYQNMPKLKSATEMSKHLVEMAKKGTDYRDDTTVVMVVLRPWWDPSSE